MTAVENKIPDVSSLVKKSDYNAKILEIESEVTNHDHVNYINISEFNKLTAENFKVRLVQANLVAKTDFRAKLKSLNKKVNSNKTKHLLVENELKELQTFCTGYFRGKNYFDDVSTQNVLLFQPMNKYFKKISNTENISSWESKGMFNEVINPLDNTLTS